MQEKKYMVIEMKKLKTIDIEIAVAMYLNPRVNLIVPNIGWGMFIHECDLLVITKHGYATEIEIKTSRADLIKDKNKGHNHENRRVKCLYFAIPDYLLLYQEHIPERAGIIVVDSKHEFFLNYKIGRINFCPEMLCETIREPKSNKTPYKFKDKEMYNVARLGAMRIWGLKRKIIKLNELGRKQ